MKFRLLFHERTTLDLVLTKEVQKVMANLREKPQLSQKAENPVQVRAVPSRIMCWLCHVVTLVVAMVPELALQQLGGT